MNAVPAPGLHDAVHDAQAAFRVALDALSRPGRIHRMADAIVGVPLGAAQARLLLTLTDESTPVWWQVGAEGLQPWLRFHTGARAAASTQDADFAVIADARELRGLHRFAAGTASSPERSCTLLVEVRSLRGGNLVQASGPGIRDGIELAIDGVPDSFWDEWHANHASFPQGLDIFFTCGSEVLGLPRTSRIARLQEV